MSDKGEIPIEIEIINNSRDGLIAKIDMFIDLINAEINPARHKFLHQTNWSRQC